MVALNWARLGEVEPKWARMCKVGQVQTSQKKITFASILFLLTNVIT
jgi:hypothetical protein